MTKTCLLCVQLRTGVSNFLHQVLAKWCILRLFNASQCKACPSKKGRWKPSWVCEWGMEVLLYRFKVRALAPCGIENFSTRSDDLCAKICILWCQVKKFFQMTADTRANGSWCCSLLIQVATPSVQMREVGHQRWSWSCLSKMFYDLSFKFREKCTIINKDFDKKQWASNQNSNLPATPSSKSLLVMSFKMGMTVLIIFCTVTILSSLFL